MDLCTTEQRGFMCQPVHDIIIFIMWRGCQASLANEERTILVPHGSDVHDYFQRYLPVYTSRESRVDSNSEDSKLESVLRIFLSLSVAIIVAQELYLFPFP